MRTTPESFGALLAKVEPEARRLVPGWSGLWLRVCVDHRDHGRPVPLVARVPSWFSVLLRLRRKHLAALAASERDLERLVLYVLVHEVGRRVNMPECCLNKLAPWPANVKCP